MADPVLIGIRLNIVGHKSGAQMALSLGKERLVTLSIGALAGLLSAAVTASFWASDRLRALDDASRNVAALRASVSKLECQTQKVNLAIDDLATLVEKTSMLPSDVAHQAIRPSISSLQRRLRDPC